MEIKDLKKIYRFKLKEYIKHNKLYYQKSHPKISDSEFDDLKNEIIELEKKHKFLKIKTHQVTTLDISLQNHSISINTEYLCYHFRTHLMRMI